MFFKLILENDNGDRVDMTATANRYMTSRVEGLNGYGKEKALTNPPAPVSDDCISVEITVDGKKHSGKLNKA